MTGKHTENVFILFVLKIPEKTIKSLHCYSPIFASMDGQSGKILGPVTLRGGLGINASQFSISFNLNIKKIYYSLKIFLRF